MPSKEPRTCPVCQRPGIVNLSQHLNSVHSICGQERKQLIRGGLVGTELMTREPQSNIEKHIVFLDMLHCGEVLRGELIRKARLEELKAILELCLNMKEGNLTMPTRNPHCTIVTTLANRNISLSNKKKWMLEYNKILFNIISPALKEWKRKFRRIYIGVNITFCIHLIWLIKEEGRLKRANALRKTLHLLQYLLNH